MSDEKQIIDDEYEFDSVNEFDDGRSVNSEAEIDAEIGSKRKARIWLYVGLGAFLLAALLRLVVVPVLETQRQRVNQITDIANQIELTNSSGTYALTEDGGYEGLKENVVNFNIKVDAFVQPKSLWAKLANSIFSNTESNTQLKSALSQYNAAANTLIANEAGVTQAKGLLLEAGAEVNSAATDTIAFVDAVAKEGRSRTTEDAKNRYLFLTSEAANINGILSRLASGLNGYYRPNENLKTLSDGQNTLVARLKDTLVRITGNAAAAVSTAAKPIQQKLKSIETKVAGLAENTTAITNSRVALQQMQTKIPTLNTVINATANQAGRVALITVLTNLLPLLLVLFGIFSMWRFFNLQSRGLVESEGNLSDALADQQESILKLLDEMSALADGDLTVEAEVTDQITGAIADSVNFAVIEMRDLVGQINRASIEVANESELAVDSAQSVSQSNKQQADRITSAAQEMQRVTESMREMSEQALSSSEMASESIQAATEGAQAVRDTISGMDDMREQIQDTSKRIKRLGESSQRIGDIVALIDDIAEQTNILSLNAAIQASMAGEAGRGFAVVSDEVQSLAERSTEATRKIAALVEIIQNDTNDAVLSMEQATQHVINGTKIADTAGTALAGIENISQKLSSLIEAISKRSNNEAHVVMDVAEKVTKVSNSSTETSQKAEESANSIAKLLKLAKELEISVSRFKLPTN